MENFLFFYQEIINLRQFIDSHGQFISQETLDSQDSQPTQISAKRISDFLCGILRNLTVQSTQISGAYATELHHEAEFVMAAWADEMFFHQVDWKGRSDWKDNLLEARMFESYSAGTIFFEKLDILLKQEDRADRDLAKIYLLALKFGFEGKYRGSSSAKRLMDYRSRLFTFIMNREASIADSPTHLFQQAYNHTINDKGESTYLPSMKRWILSFGVFVLLYALASIVIWNSYINPILEIINPYIGL